MAKKAPTVKVPKVKVTTRAKPVKLPHVMRTESQTRLTLINPPPTKPD